MSEVQEVQAEIIDDDSRGSSNASSAPSRADVDRIAQDYAKAVSDVANLAGIVLNFVPGGKFKTAARVAQRVAATAPAAAKAAPDVVVKAAPVAQKLATSAGNTLMGAAKSAAGVVAKRGEEVVAGFGIAAENAKAAAAGKPTKNSTAKHAKAKTTTKKSAPALPAKTARNQSRQEVLSAVNSFSIKEYRTWRAGMAGAPDLLLDQPGCFVMVLLNNAEDEVSDFREVLVDGGSSMAKCIDKQLAGEGNRDIYADVKYGQPVRILAYPCAKTNVKALRDSLIIALDADRSYNAKA